MSDPMLTTVTASAAAAEYPDDGHIVVCVRVRDVPQSIACLPNGNGATAVPSSAGASAVARKSLLRDANRICVSVVENVVVMHDPKSMDDAATVAKDGNNVVQMLTHRTTQMSGSRPSHRAAADARTPPASRTSSRRTQQGGAVAQLVSTGTANYYEYDHCIASMEEAQLMQMPLIRTSDFLQPPPYGTQEEVYQSTAIHAVTAAVDGINSCVFAYGQTGSGKTYTLFGDTANIRRNPGVVPRTFDDLFHRLESVKQSYQTDALTDYSCEVQLSFYEIYQNEVYCLLSRQGPLHVQFVRDGTDKKERMIIHDLQQQTVTSAENAYPMIEMGLRRRQTAETGMNARSSRSHAVLQISVTQYRTNRETRETVEHRATVNLVDLAGSERQRTAHMSDSSRAEGIQINQSLATLARVINDIARGSKFINYRDSLLTMVLKDNLGGNSKTFMIANISPIAFSYQESCATLAYAKDVRKIRNRPTVNKTFQTRANLLEQNILLKRENKKLKGHMEAWVCSLQDSGSGGGAHSAATQLIGLPSVHGARETLFLRSMKALSLPVALPPDLLRAANASVMGAGAMACCSEALVSSTTNGLTTPLLVASHRRYTSAAGVGGSCVESGVVRVSALVQPTAEFPLARVLHPLPTTTRTPRRCSTSSGAADADADESAAQLTAETPEGTSSSDGRLSGDEAQRPTAAYADLTPETEAHEEGMGSDAEVDLGVLVLERVAQRSCEQRYYVHFRPPTTAAMQARLIDVQVNGTSVGAKGRRELHHGDVVCAYVEDAVTTASGMAGTSAGLRGQSVVSFHYVDLNALSRDASAVAGGLGNATPGQTAVSADLPANMENLTLEGIKQLQRDNAKLLDMVRQQAETIDYQHMRATASLMTHENLLEGISPVGSPGNSASPSPRLLEASPTVSPATPPLTATRKAAVVFEAFRRLSVPPAIRGSSLIPADVSADEMRCRAASQSASQQRLDSAVRESVVLHCTAATCNATLDALTRQVAELESVGSLSCSSHAPPSAPTSICQSVEHNEMGGAEAGVVDVDPDDMSSHRAATHELHDEEEEDEEAHEAERVGSGTCSIALDHTEGSWERERLDRVYTLEETIRDLRERLGELDGRLRLAKDETLEQQVLRFQAEAERDALLEELINARSENAELQRDNASLQGFLAKDELALADAARLADEELERQTSVLTDRLVALTSIARLWKQRTMKYMAMSYGAGSGAADSARLDALPWNDLRVAETVAIAKRRLGKGEADACPPVMAQTVDAFEAATAQENLRALEYALLACEQENQQLLGEVDHIQGELSKYKNLVNRLRSERTQMEKALADASNATVEEAERCQLQRQLLDTNAQLDEAETNLRETQSRLHEAVAHCDTNKRRAVKSTELLVAQQKTAMVELGAEVDRLRRDYAYKDEELANLVRYVQDCGAMAGADGVAKSSELHARIEKLVSDAMEGHEAPSGCSVFPDGFEFTDEMAALIGVCLRILMDGLKAELYVLNAQSVHRFQLLIHAVRARTEAHFHTFMHQLRDAVSQMTGRTVRPGGTWGLSESDVLSTLVDHRCRQVGDALNGLLVWYDHWDRSPKREHVVYLELLRNADRIMQMARLVRRESLLSTNATSTSLVPIPDKSGTSGTSRTRDSTRRKDKTVRNGRAVFSRLASSRRQSNLARAVKELAATPSSYATIADGKKMKAGVSPSNGDACAAAEERASGSSLSATATALELSQSIIPVRRTATSTRTTGSGGGDGGHPAASSHRRPSSVGLPATTTAAAATETCPPFTRCPATIPRPSVPAGPVHAVAAAAAAAATATEAPTRASASSTATAASSMKTPPPPSLPPQQQHSHPSTATQLHPAKPKTPGVPHTLLTASPAAAARTTTTTPVRTTYSRITSVSVLPVPAAQVDHVASTGVAEVVSIGRYKSSQRITAAGAPRDAATAAAGRSELMRHGSQPFSRCQTVAVVPTASDSANRQPQQRPRHRQASATVSPCKAVPATTSSAAQPFARAKTQHTMPTSTPTRTTHQSAHRSGQASSTGGSACSSVLSDAMGFSRAPLSAFPTTTTTPTSTTTSAAAAATNPWGGSRPLSMQTLGKRASSAEPRPMSFYNSDVVRSLRERTASDANRTSTLDGSGAKAGAAASSTLHKKRLGTSSSGMTPQTKKRNATSTTSASPNNFIRTLGDSSSGGPCVPKLDFSNLEYME